MNNTDKLEDRVKESYIFMDTHLMKKIINYRKIINEKNSKKENTVIRDKHTINDSYINPEY